MVFKDARSCVQQLYKGHDDSATPELVTTTLCDGVLLNTDIQTFDDLQQQQRSAE